MAGGDKNTGYELNDEQRLSWLQLIRSENVGPATFRDLINHFGSASLALEAIPELASRGGAAARINVCSRDKAEREIIAAGHVGARFIGMGEPDYPFILRQLPQAPPLICIRGNVSALSKNSVSIVGSRNCSISGTKLTHRFASGLGEKGYVITSGLARGIDTAAHKAALTTGTIAVFAGGVDVVFPDENKNLAQQILENDGAIVSEMAVGWKPRSKDFPRRNRIITGLSHGVLVVEAAKRSGSLITARLSNEAGRLVFAVPGSPLDPRSAGTNHLIREGAILASDIEDIIEALKPLEERSTDLFSESEADEPFGEGLEGDFQPSFENTENERTTIIDALGPSPVYIDDIVRFSNMSVGQVQLVLVELDLAGRLERHVNGQVSLLVEE